MLGEHNLHKCLDVTLLWEPTISLSHTDIKSSKIKEYFNNQRINLALNNTNNNNY